MSIGIPPEEERAYPRALAAARAVFPPDRKGKYFREAARRMSAYTRLSYAEALDALQEAGERAVAAAIARRLEEAVPDGVER